MINGHRTASLYQAKSVIVNGPVITIEPAGDDDLSISVYQMPELPRRAYLLESLETDDVAVLVCGKRYTAKGS